jgi:hypothetical protein
VQQPEYVKLYDEKMGRLRLFELSRFFARPDGVWYILRKYSLYQTGVIIKDVHAFAA